MLLRLGLELTTKVCQDMKMLVPPSLPLPGIVQNHLLGKPPPPLFINWHSHIPQLIHRHARLEADS